MDLWRSPHGRPLPPVGGRTLIMGILNVTPDSFSDGGELPTVEAVLSRAAAMIEAGADVLDLGGESTRPGSAPVGEAEELARVLPAIRAIRSRWPEVPLSIDTFKPRVAEAAVVAGADILNDVWGFTHEFDTEARAVAIRALTLASDAGRGLPTPPEQATPAGSGDLALPVRSAMAATVARLKCPVIIMHNRPDRAYSDFLNDVVADLRLSLALAESAGVPSHQIWLDPGFGFAKGPAENLEVLKHLDRIVALGFPVMVGTSRKSTIGKVLGTTVDDRIEGTAATVVWAIAKGCAMVRVHDVAAMQRYVRMADAIKAGAKFQG